MSIVCSCAQTGNWSSAVLNLMPSTRTPVCPPIVTGAVSWSPPARILRLPTHAPPGDLSVPSVQTKCTVFEVSIVSAHASGLHGPLAPPAVNTASATTPIQRISPDSPTSRDHVNPPTYQPANLPTYQPTNLPTYQPLPIPSVRS